MFWILGGLKNLIKVYKVSIDNYVFRLHYRVTVALLLGSSVFVTSKQYVGDPIDCIATRSVPSEVLDNFCWTQATFSMKHGWLKQVGEEVAYPGIDGYVPGRGEERVFHAYYQWVCFVLFFQAALFLMPRYLWKAAEGKKVSFLVMDLSDPVNSDDKRNSSINVLCRYFRENRGFHRGYVFYFFACELLNFINVVGQMFLVDKFLGGVFWTYGIKVLQFSKWDQAVRYDPMIEVFPRLTKCTFHQFGHGGDVEWYPTLCVLPVNVINEKIYLLMWFWFLFLACISFFNLVYRAVIVFWRHSRYLLLASRARLADTQDLNIICAKSDIGDWFLLSLLSKNLDAVAYKMLASRLRRQLEGGGKDTEASCEVEV